MPMETPTFEQKTEKILDVVADNIIDLAELTARQAVSDFHEWLMKNRETAFLSMEAAREAFWEQYNG